MKRRDGERHQDHRQRQARGDDEDDDEIDAAAEIAGRARRGVVPMTPDMAAARDADQERDARAVDETAEIVAAELVGAEHVGPAAALVPDRRDQALARDPGR